MWIQTRATYGSLSRRPCQGSRRHRRTSCMKECTWRCFYTDNIPVRIDSVHLIETSSLFKMILVSGNLYFKIRYIIYDTSSDLLNILHLKFGWFNNSFLHPLIICYIILYTTITTTRKNRHKTFLKAVFVFTRLKKNTCNRKLKTS